MTQEYQDDETQEDRLDAPLSARRIEKSSKGRLKFLPGDPHALDVQLREARNYRLLLAEQMSQLQETIADVAQLGEQSAQNSLAELALKTFLWERYKHHKHRDHITATFLSVRRKRQLERLQAAQVALRLARDFLAPDDTLLHDLRSAVESPVRDQELPEARPDQQPPEEGEGRQQHRFDPRQLYGETQTTKAQLAAFDEQVRLMRSAITSGNGWFETYFITKERISFEAREYLKRREQVPEHVPLFEKVIYGPYLKYRWREEGNAKAPLYTIQMGLIPDAGDDDEADEEEREAPPWPNL